MNLYYYIRVQLNQNHDVDIENRMQQVKIFVRIIIY